MDLFSKAAVSSMTVELGTAGAYDPNQGIKQDEFIASLRGINAIKMYREMRENDPIAGAILMAIEMVLRAVDWTIQPVDDTPGAEEARDFVEEVFKDMDHTFEEFISEVVGMLPYGFAVFEIVLKKRNGPSLDLDKHSSHDDGKIGIHKLAPRAQWTLRRFEIDKTGRVLGVHQSAYQMGHTNVFIPAPKMLLFKTTSSNNDPSGRSVLRNGYRSYHYIKRIQEYEAIAIERELNGLPVGRLPSSYLAATDGPQKTFKDAFVKALRDVKKNEQGFLLLPSDPYMDEDGKPTATPLVSFELVASSGTRDIDTTKVIVRHQQDMARSVLADFLMLGQSERGSFALSKNKTDLFLQALTGFVSNIAAVLNRDLLPRIWQINGFDMGMMPEFVPGNVAPVDLEELGSFLQRLAMSGAPLFPDEELEDVVRTIAGLPERVTSDAEIADLIARPATGVEGDGPDVDDEVAP